MIRSIVFGVWFSIVSSPIPFVLGGLAIIASIIASKKNGRAATLKLFLPIILVSIASLSAISIVRIDQFCSHVVEPKAYEAIRLSMNKDQVIELLGEPLIQDQTIWRYERPGVWEFVEIEFDTDGKVKSKFRDS